MSEDEYPTGPIDFQDLEALLADPYLRDSAGRFAAHPADEPREIVRRGHPTFDPTGVTVTAPGRSTYTAVRVVAGRVEYV